MSSPSEAEAVAGPVIAQLIGKEVERTQATTASLQSRGLAVISSSGTLVTLLFGLAALATQAADFTLTAATKVPLIVAAVLLVLAAVAGIATNAPRQKHAIGLDGLAQPASPEFSVLVASQRTVRISGRLWLGTDTVP